jgi:PASTA domain
VADDDGLDETRQFPAATGDQGDETARMPAADADGDPTEVLPSAWAGRAGVPSPDAIREASPTVLWQEPVAPQRRWWLPVGIAALALALLALVGFGLWLIFKEDDNGSNPLGPVASASGSATASPSRSRATASPTGDTSQNVPERVVVPRLSGADVDSAQKILDEVGLTYQLAFRASSTAPPNTVIETRPGEGSVVRKGSQVTLVIASAPPSSAPPSPSPSPAD